MMEVGVKLGTIIFGLFKVYIWIIEPSIYLFIAKNIICPFKNPNEYINSTVLEN